MSWIDDKARSELAIVRENKERQTYPYFREFESGGLHTSVGGKPIINFSSNDYLGLTNHPKVKAAANAAVEKYGCGLSSSRPQATTTEHVELEKRLAKWFGYESCLLFTTGYQAMLGTIVALADKDTTLVLDSYSHACILDGTFLAAGIPGRAPEVRFFNHNSAKSLERILKTRERKNALVLIEGVYSLDGDKANIKEFVEICERYDAVLVMDDAHGTGTLGTRGTGILEETGLKDRVPVLVSTFSKTFGGIGGILLGRSDIVELVKHNARSFLFSASLPVPVVAAASTILDMLETDGPAMVTELHQKAAYMRGKLKDIGFELGASNTHIMPVMCREERKTVFMHIGLFESGVMMVPLIYPSVKHGEERLRVNVTRGHTQEDMDTALELLKTYGEAFFVLSGEEIGPMEA
ncbi:8-amino-7-oxononanoate synthase [Labilithrix luteola]|uniref:8-amino-7-oxononanoate synthase n=1 Tax=Labilithrix luteola TaxID=1391654 RepID=A0A0K1Q929_9BACT|nr:pyridoxal phosphate-dependent aminotransferase family protein [Labilithrix luteola]AKV02228.1 8-amino-7-oxononanoate synthase [Labilithrix luteola]